MKLGNSVQFGKRFRLMVWGLLALVLVGLWGRWSGADAPAMTGGALSHWQRPDGTPVTYYAAGDEFLTTAFDLLDDYWSDIADRDRTLLRGHLDHYLPPELKALNHEPATALMADFTESFFAARQLQTGLIPYAYDTPIPGDPNNPTEADLTSENKQPVGLIGRAIEFCRWFPDDPSVQTHCAELARSTQSQFDVPAADQPNGQPNGLWGWVDVTSDRAPRSSLTLTQDYGDVALAMATLSNLTAEAQWLQWADQKLQFVWQHPMNPDLPILQEQFVLTQALTRPDEPSSDTDTLYFVRRLFDLYALTQTPRYRDWAMAVTDLWFANAWNPQGRHFIRKLNPDGTPAVDTLYGDGKYNTLYMLVRAYEVTGNGAYLERLKQAWDSLVQMGQQGLAPESIRQGTALREAGLDAQQTIFLDILVEAFHASGDRTFLDAAETLGQAILKRGTTVMRLESGQAGHAFLKLAMARQNLNRIELTLPQPRTPLRIYQAGQRILQVTPPTAAVVVYLPSGPYEVR